MRNPKRILLDECVPKPLAALIENADVVTTQEMGWDSKRNGELLRLAETEFDVFLTSDQNIRYQQNLSSRIIAIVILPSNRWPQIKNNADAINRALSEISEKEFREVQF